MSAWTVLGAACVLLTADTTVRPLEEGWVEDTRLEVGAEGWCEHVDVHLPPGSTLDARKVRLRRVDRRNLKLGDDHWERLDPGLAGDNAFRVHLPELAAGDRARIWLDITHTGPEAFRWRPEAGFASLKLTEPLQVTTYGDVRSDRREWWTSKHGVEVRIHRSDPTIPAIPVDLPQRFDPPPALPADAAQADLATMVLVPREIDGRAPLIGPEALRRGAVDDRGFARTLVMMTAGGPDRVELGGWLPAHHTQGNLDVLEGEVAVWYAEDGPVVMQHPSAPPRRGQVWTPSGVIEAQVGGSAHPYEAASRALPRLVQHRAMLIDLPEGDPQAALYPGGGSRVLVRHGVVFPVDGRARPFVLPVPSGVGDIAVTTEPPNVAEPLWTLRLRDHDTALVVGPTPYTFAVLFEWMQDDAEACGVVPSGHNGKWIVDATGGEVVWTGENSWHLASWGDTPVVTDHEALVTGLERRFATRSMPEPALPMRLKNAPASWDLAALLRPTLLQRARVAELPLRPGWPRPLNKARRWGAVTPLEAALILRLYALQSGLEADWVMVRPASEGSSRPVCPEAYPQALVRVVFEGETRWIDPACSVCAPFEVRPSLLGAAALGPGIEETPPPEPGTWEVEVGPDEVSWHMTGPAALGFRLWLADVPADDRSEAIASRVAGDGASLVSEEGIAEAGADIALTVRRPAGAWVGEDPLVLPEPRQDDATWMGWVGERRLRVVGDETAAEQSTLNVPGATWRRFDEDGARVEVLDVRERLLSPHASSRIRQARP